MGNNNDNDSHSGNAWVCRGEGGHNTYCNAPK